MKFSQLQSIFFVFFMAYCAEAFCADEDPTAVVSAGDSRCARNPFVWAPAKESFYHAVLIQIRNQLTSCYGQAPSNAQVIEELAHQVQIFRDASNSPEHQISVQNYAAVLTRARYEEARVGIRLQ